MSLTIRMKRALAAFRADPKVAMPIAVVEEKSVLPSNVGMVASHLEAVGEAMRMADTQVWRIHSDYHRSRIVMGHRLDWYTTKTGKRESAQYNARMYYGESVRALFRSLGIKDRWT